MITVGLLAGGKGERIGGGTAKQFLTLGDRPMIAYPLEVFSSIAEIDKIIIACNPDYVNEMTRISLQIRQGREKIKIVNGGRARHDSIVNILEMVLENGYQSGDKFILHEAARPFIDSVLIREHINMLDRFPATNTLMPVVDTIMLSNDGEFISEVPVKKNTYSGQNPQGYQLKELLEKLGKDLFDQENSLEIDLCAMFLEKGGQVKIIKGNEKLFKITHASDLDLAARYL